MFKLESLKTLIMTLLYTIILSFNIQLLIGIDVPLIMNHLFTMILMIVFLYVFVSSRKFAVGVVVLVLIALITLYWNDWFTNNTELLLDIYKPFRWMITRNELKSTMPHNFYDVFGVLICYVGFMVFFGLRSSFISLLCLWIPLFFVDGDKINSQWILLLSLISIASISGQKRNVYQPSMIGISLVLALTLGLSSIFSADTFFNNDLSHWLNDLKIFENRNFEGDFSLTSVGFNDGNTRIGGPSVLTNEPYMEVVGPKHSFALRGAIYERFENNVWYQTSMRDVEVFDSFNPSLMQRSVYGYGAKSSTGIQDMNTDIIYIQPIERTFRTVFTGIAPRMIGLGDGIPLLGDESVFRYNNAGQVSTTQLIGNRGYTLLDSVPRLKNNGLIQLSTMGFQMEQGDPILEYEEIVLEHDPDLHRLIYQDLRNHENKSLILQIVIEHFNRNYKYSLNVPHIPFDESVVEWFLENKVGYCVYFGSALTLLLQDIGIDARYVEGFAVPRSQDGTRIVTTNTAHAWTEVNFSGLGWFPVDATSSQHLEQLESGNVDGHLVEEEPFVPITPVEPPPPTTDPITPPVGNDSKDTPLTIPWSQLLSVVGSILIFGWFILRRLSLIKKREDKDYLLSHFKDRGKDLVRYLWNDILSISKNEVKNHESLKETMATLNIENQEVLAILEKAIYSHQLISEQEATRVFEFINKKSNQLYENKSWFVKSYYRWFVTCNWVVL